MTRRTVYATALVAFLAASAMTLSSIIIPRWISWDSSTPSGAPVHYTYGLHRRCSSTSSSPSSERAHSCVHFPQDSDCRGGDRYFCSMWRSVGFLMSFAVVLEGMTAIALVAVLAGGKQKREAGRGVLSGLLALVGAVQCVGMAIVAYLYDNDDRFFPGWRLDTSWILCTVSWCVSLLVAAGVAASPAFLEPEGGYELVAEQS